MGAKSENAIFFNIIKKNDNVGYYAESERELDFAYGSFDSPKAVEVKYDIKLDWQDKRLRGVKLFLRRYPQTKEVNIISKNVEKSIRQDKIDINIIQAWKYLI